MRIKAEGEPWLVSVKPDLSGSGAPAGFEVMMTFRDWAPAAEAPEGGEITPQEGWEKVDDLADAVMTKMRGPAAPEEEAAGAGPMANTAAPAFTLPLLGGSQFSLAEHKGKVVMLDFWATWCGPCIRALPTVTKVTGEYAPKGVVFAAVNLQEDADKVSGFMENKSWDFTVALDSDGSVADQFGVSAIPHSVIIDKKGVIRYVHVGFDPRTGEEELRKELEALLAE
jgi:thiol-disulfide isomerase/thioredoxin